MAETAQRGNYISQAWLVILLGLLYGGALAGVQTALSGKIEENKRAETYSVIPDLVPGADASQTQELLVAGENDKEGRVYQVRAADGSHVGWVLPGEGSGFADKIELLVGLDAQVTRITGMYVLNQKETPGLGDYITGASFRQQFRNTPAEEPLAVVKANPSASNEIRALTGATISSESVADIINQALANYRAPLQALAAGAPASE
jgi:electron transport complex protein RnfG